MDTNPPPISVSTSTPGKPAIKVTDRKYDAEGKITNWSGAWHEAKELETLVVNGFVDGLTAAQIREKYPHFSAFSYKPFQNGLNNLRKKHRKEVAARAIYDTNGASCKSILVVCCSLVVADYCC
jgi:hypothetical protein